MSICEESQITYTGDGQQVRFTFPFEYLKDTDIEVALWNEFSADYEAVVYWPDISIQPTTISQYYWTLDNATTVRFLQVPMDGDAPTVPIQPPFDWAPPGSPWPPIATGTPSENDPRITNVDNIIIQRITSVDPMIATFYPGSSIRAQDLNDNFEQLQMAIEEGQCVDASRTNELDQRYWNKTSADTVYSTVAWISDDDHVATTAAMDNHFAAVLQPSAGSVVIVADEPPLVVPLADGATRVLREGDLWFNSDRGDLFVWYVDEDSSQWVSVSHAGAPGPQGDQGEQGPAGPPGPAGGGVVDTITGTAPITVDSTDTENPVVAINAATTTAVGAVQIETTVSNSATNVTTGSAVQAYAVRLNFSNLTVLP